MRRSVPGVLWVTVATLAAQALLYTWASIRMPDLLLLAALWAVIIFGLIVGHGWAFIVAIGLTLLDTLLVAIRAGSIGLVALGLDVLVIAPLLLSRRYFFTDRPAREAPEDAARDGGTPNRFLNSREKWNGLE
jgi:hypothetical protein